MVLPSLSAHEFWTNLSTSHLLSCASSPPQLPVSTPPTSRDECFFNSLVVGPPQNLNIWQFLLFFVFKFVVVLLLVVEGSEASLPMCPLWLDSWAAFSKSLAYQYRSRSQIWASVMTLPLPGCVVLGKLYNLFESGGVVGRIEDNRNKEKYPVNGSCY